MSNKRIIINSHQIVPRVGLIICLLLIILLFYVHQSSTDTHPALLVESKDEKIEIKWKNYFSEECKSVEINICDESGAKVCDEEVPSFAGRYKFTEGEINNKYIVTVRAKDTDGNATFEKSYERLFLDYAKLPEIPILQIETDGYDDPTYAAAVPSESNVLGATITGNEYISAKIIASGFENTSKIQAGKIKVRGNTSSMNSDKKAYKIKFDRACKLISEETALKEWVLLNNGDNLKTYVGCLVGETLGIEWQPRVRFVNLILNGDWKGIYCLIPAVDRESTKGLVSESGYIFESDAYWWATDDCYFRTEAQTPSIAYTFKYPNISDEDDERLAYIYEYMQRTENAIVFDETDYKELIDESSWINYILARDIIANRDGAGTNTFYYMKSDSPENDVESKLKMGPLWDMDRAFELTDIWSDCRTAITTYFSYLFEKEDFEKAYIKKWEQVSPTIYNGIETSLEELSVQDGEDLDRSLYLDAVRWSKPYISYETQKEEMLDWILEHLAWMNVELQAPNYFKINPSEFDFVDGIIICSIDKVEPVETGIHLEGWAYKSSEIDENYIITAIIDGDRLYPSVKLERPDVREALGVDELYTGFSVFVPNESYTNVCMVDMRNKIIYK